MERVEADLGVRCVLDDRFLVAAGHVDRDGTDALGSLRAELVEERLQRLGVSAGRAPHDRARLVVHDTREVAVMAAIADLVDADRDQAVQAALIEAL
jgi:hypothetical protein